MIRMIRIVLSCFLLVEYATASFPLPDTAFRMTYCIGPDCPSVSLPFIEGRHFGGNFSDKCNGTKAELVPDPLNCQSYFACNNGNAIKLTCTLGYAFHSGFEVCVPDTFVKSCAKIYCPPTMLVGTVPDVKSCNRYYKCVYGIPMHFQCDPGYIYDDYTGKCKSYGDFTPTCISSSEGGIGNPEGSSSTPELPLEANNSSSTVAVPVVGGDAVGSPDETGVSSDLYQPTTLPSDSESSTVSPSAQLSNGQ